MVKAYARPAMRKLGIAEVFLTVSASNPIQRHMTAVLEAPLVLQSGMYDAVCSCMGWTRHKHCWHTDEAVEVATAQVNFYDAVELLQRIRSDLEADGEFMPQEYIDAIDTFAELIPEEHWWDEGEAEDNGNETRG